MNRQLTFRNMNYFCFFFWHVHTERFMCLYGRFQFEQNAQQGNKAATVNINSNRHIRHTININRHKSPHNARRAWVK